MQILNSHSVYDLERGEMRVVSYVILTLSFIFCCACPVVAQNQSGPQWIRGKGSSHGTDLAEMRAKALNAARADALKATGIVVTTADVAVKSESGNTLTDFFTNFTEAATRGLILEERNVKFGKPVPVSESGDDLNAAYTITVEVEALVAVQTGERTPGFEVQLSADRDVYEDGEPVYLTITSTKDGYLTVFFIENDSLTVLYPNSITPKNFITAGAPLNFPCAKGERSPLSLRMETIPGRSRSEATFMAIVSKDNVPFTPPDEMRIEGSTLKLQQAMLTKYANWLYKIPLNDRASDVKGIQIVRKNK